MISNPNHKSYNYRYYREKNKVQIVSSDHLITNSQKLSTM